MISLGEGAISSSTVEVRFSEESWFSEKTIADQFVKSVKKAVDLLLKSEEF